MLKRAAFLIACLVCMVAGSALAEEKVLINGIDANYPPFAYVDQSGKPGGFDVDAVDWIAAKMGFKVKHVPVDWDGIIPNLLAKKIDFIWDVANDHPEKLYQGKAAERLELDRLIKRMGKLTQQRKDLEGQLAATLSELETIRKRMDELSK